MDNIQEQLTSLNARMEREFIEGYRQPWGLVRYIMRQYNDLIEEIRAEIQKRAEDFGKELQDKKTSQGSGKDKQEVQKAESASPAPNPDIRMPKAFYALLKGECLICGRLGQMVTVVTEDDEITASCQRCGSFASSTVEGS